MLACAGVSMFLQILSPTIIGGPGIVGDLLHDLVGAFSVIIILLAAGLGWAPPAVRPAGIIWLSGALCIAVGWLSASFWPNSGDEHSYVYLADTFLRERLTNPAAPDPELFRMYRVFTLPGQTISQYPPGWPLVIAPFRALGVEWLAGPTMTLLLGLALRGALDRLRITPPIQSATLMLVLFTPFVLFNGGSMFSQSISAALAATITWQQLADEDRPGIARKLLIGACFGALLLTRYEVFAIFVVLFGLDRLLRRRARALLDALPMLVGLLPFVGFFLSYNWIVTGDPLLTPAAMTNPDMTFAEALADVGEAAGRAGEHLLYWLGILGQFGGLLLLVLCLATLAGKMSWRSLRFYDLALPATMIFFLYFPHDGDHQYGPRYWFFAWPLAGLTVARALVRPDGTLRGFGQLGFSSVVAGNLAFCAIMMPGLIWTTRAYIDARREILADIVPNQPAIVLLPNREIDPFDRHQDRIAADNRDFDRNDVDFSNPVLYGLATAPNAVARACALPGHRTVYEWIAPGRLNKKDCR